MLVETTEGVYLWQSEVGEDMKGSGKRQFDISRRLALETTVNYCKGLFDYVIVLMMVLASECL